jgi:hypothetical protein
MNRDDLWRRHSFSTPYMSVPVMDKAGFNAACAELRPARMDDQYRLFADLRMANIMAGEELLAAERHALEYVLTEAKREDLS